jgi:ribosomal protein S25
VKKLREEALSGAMNEKKKGEMKSGKHVSDPTHQINKSASKQVIKELKEEALGTKAELKRSMGMWKNNEERGGTKFT